MNAGIPRTVRGLGSLALVSRIDDSPRRNAEAWPDPWLGPFEVRAMLEPHTGTIDRLERGLDHDFARCAEAGSLLRLQKQLHRWERTALVAENLAGLSGLDMAGRGRYLEELFARWLPRRAVPEWAPEPGTPADPLGGADGAGRWPEPWLGVFEVRAVFEVRGDVRGFDASIERALVEARRTGRLLELQEGAPTEVGGMSNGMSPVDVTEVTEAGPFVIL
jgi:hypothetical protein